MKLEHAVTRLPNGLVVASAPWPPAESVALGLWIRAGGRHEPAARSGVNHLLEHLLFKGTPTRSARDIAAEVEGCGGYLDAVTQEESTCFYARVPRERADRVFGVLADMYRHATLAPRDVEAEKAVIVEELRMHRDQPEHRVHERLDGLLWAGHALGRDLAGSERTLAGLTPGLLRRHRDAVMTPANTVLVAAGAVAHAEWVARAARAFGRLPPGRPLPWRRVRASTPQRDVHVERDRTEQAHLALGVRLFGRGDRRRYALKLLSILLGESAGSRLFQEIRERRGWAYGIQSEVHLYAETGVLSVSAGLDRDRALDAVRRVFLELRRFRERPVGAAALRVAKDYAAGQLRLGLEAVSHRLSWVGEHLAGLGRVVPPAEVLDGMARVDAAGLQALARAVLRPERVSVALLLPGDPARVAPEVRRAIGSLS